MCGELRLSDAGKKVALMGWCNRRRDLGQIIFVDLRDRTGVTQVVFNHERNAAVHQKAEVLRNEFVIAGGWHRLRGHPNSEGCRQNISGTTCPVEIESQWTARKREAEVLG